MMNEEESQAIALTALSYILENETLQARFMELSGLTPDQVRCHLQEKSFQENILGFLVSHEPDLMAFAQDSNENPERIVKAWRILGGGIGQEW